MHRRTLVTLREPARFARRDFLRRATTWRPVRRYRLDRAATVNGCAMAEIGTCHVARWLPNNRPVGGERSPARLRSQRRGSLSALRGPELDSIRRRAACELRHDVIFLRHFTLAQPYF
jgi:hypothetical protein